MILDFAPGWSVATDRGPDWLFIKLLCESSCDSEGIDLATQLQEAMEKELVHRLVVEMDDIGLLRSHLVGELVVLHQRICTQGGIMRLAGLSDENYAVLTSCHLDSRFPRYANREEAVLGHRPKNPR